MKSSPGNTIIEYSLIGLVALASISGLSMAGGKIAGQMDNFRQSLVGPPGSSGVAASGTTSVAGSTLQAGETITLSNGTTVTLPYSTGNMANSVEVSGVNGTTGNLLADLNALAQQLQASGDITPAQASDITALAQQGYRLAALEQKIEETFQQTGPTQAFWDATITFEGQSYTTKNIVGLLGFAPTSSVGQSPADLLQSNPDFMLETNNSYPLTRSFLEAYDQVMADGSGMTDPVVKQTITQLATEVSYLSYTMMYDYGWARNSADGYYYDYTGTTQIPLADSYKITLSDLQAQIIGDAQTYDTAITADNTVSGVTTVDSSQICSQGSGC